MLPIDVAAHGSRWRGRHPLEKALLGLGLTVTAVCLPPWPGGPLVAAATLAVLLGPAGVAGRQLWRAFRIPLGFCFTGALPLLFAVGGPQGLVAMAPDGPRHAAELLLRTSAASLGLLLFAFTTPVSDVLPRLVRAGVPAPVVDVALVMYRITFLLLDSLAQVRRAQAARLGHTGRAAVWRSWPGSPRPPSYGPSTARPSSRPGWPDAATTARCGSWSRRRPCRGGSWRPRPGCWRR